MVAKISLLSLTSRGLKNDNKETLLDVRPLRNNRVIDHGLNRVCR